MATYTIKINERTKFGRVISQMIKMWISEKKVELIQTPNKTTLKSMGNIEMGKDLTKSTSHADLMHKLNS